MAEYRFYSDAALFVKRFSPWSQKLILHGGDRGERQGYFLAVLLGLTGFILLADSYQEIRVVGFYAVQVLSAEVAGICQKCAYFYI